jgi:hypothetical protein
MFRQWGPFTRISGDQTNGYDAATDAYTSCAGLPSGQKCSVDNVHVGQSNWPALQYPFCPATRFERQKHMMGGFCRYVLVLIRVVFICFGVVKIRL